MATEAEVRKAAATFEFPGFRVANVVQCATDPNTWALEIQANGDTSRDTRCFTPSQWLMYWDWVRAGRPFTDEWFRRL